VPIDTDIQDAITKNLPAAVGDALRERLNMVSGLEKELAAYKAAGDKVSTMLTEQKLENNALKAKLASAEDILKREAGLVKNEREAEIKAAVLNAQQKLIDSFLDRQERIVLAVFANAKLKYQESRSDGLAFPTPPTPGNPYPCPQMATTTSSRTVETA
jgi:hypothetical protein